jgi:hypothetical protein
MRYPLGSLLTPAFWLSVFAGGLAVALAPIALPGLVLGGSACGGGGNEQVCLGIARELTLVEISSRAWLSVAAGAAVAAAAALALVIRHDALRLTAAVVVFALALTAFAQTARVDAKLGPEGGGTWGRSDEEWGAFLRPALLDLRADKRRELVGTRQRPGAAPYEREQTLETFSVLPRTGWKLLNAALVALLFASIYEATRRLLRRPGLAAVVAITGGTMVWALVEDRSYECNPDASECYRGLLTFLAFVGVALAWAAYGLGVVAGRFMLPRLRRLRA